ncbi:MOSC domain-containing protein [Microbacteriaceae bacterium VKM Ac-2855]|nr:MOSC domain-containing protein [Microbacteriaceae bacterium VKM Ac-2855]
MTPGTGHFVGEIVGLYTCAIAGEEMQSREMLMLLAGKGVEGDRYLTGTGHYSKRPHADRQVTLIESEVLDALQRDQGLILPPEETRRNVVTRGVPLAHLVGRRFRLGGVVLFGGRLNIPCKYLEDINDRPGVFNALVNRSGLNAQIIEGGPLHLGDRIEPIG